MGCGGSRDNVSVLATNQEEYDRMLMQIAHQNKFAKTNSINKIILRVEMTGLFFFRRDHLHSSLNSGNPFHP